MTSRWRAALQAGGAATAFLYVHVIIYGFLSEHFLVLYAWGLVVCLALGSLAAVWIFWRASRALEERRGSEGMMDVELSRWRRGKPTSRRSVRLGEIRYEWEVTAESKNVLRGALRDSTETEVVRFPRFDEYVAAFSRRLRGGPVVGEGEFASMGPGPGRIEISKAGRDLHIRLSSDERTVFCEVRLGSLWVDGVRVLKRDALGWQVQERALREHSEVCALVLLSGLHRFVK